MKELEQKLQELSDKKIAEHSKKFFKTGKGEYGEGDLFLGIRVPALRKLAKEFYFLERNSLSKLITSPWHEKRLLGFLIIVLKYQKEKKISHEWYDFYLKHFEYINNWDLVDTTCYKIIGAELFDKNRDILKRWAKSDHLWTRRISMMSTFYFIQRNEFDDTLYLAKILRNDQEDLIQKVVGWMLREVGKRDKKSEDKFLRKYYHQMPRVMLRYAIEKYPEGERKKILQGTW